MNASEISKVPCLYLGGLGYLRSHLNVRDPKQVEIYREVKKVVESHCSKVKEPCTKCCPSAAEFKRLVQLCSLNNINIFQYYSKRWFRRVDKSYPRTLDELCARYPIPEPAVAEGDASTSEYNPDGSSEGAGDRVSENESESSGSEVRRIKTEPGLEDLSSDIAGSS
jgi:hypothetical protein